MLIIANSYRARRCCVAAEVSSLKKVTAVRGLAMTVAGSSAPARAQEQEQEQEQEQAQTTQRPRRSASRGRIQRPPRFEH